MHCCQFIEQITLTEFRINGELYGAILIWEHIRCILKHSTIKLAYYDFLEIRAQGRSYTAYGSTPKY